MLRTTLFAGIAGLLLLFASVSQGAISTRGAALPTRTKQVAKPIISTSLRQRIHGCIACHGRYGQGGGSGGYAPRIGGKPVGYLYHQLLNFRDGRRTYPLMTWMVKYLPDAYMREIAEYFSRQSPPFIAPPIPMVSKASLAAGHQLATLGDSAQKVPACMACHGKQLMGVEPNVPGLVGLSNDYISAQLGAFRQGIRTTVEPNCMGKITHRLTGVQIAAVSAWIASQPVPVGARPAPAGSVKFPLRCGSIEK